MGDGCSGHNLPATLAAKNQADGLDLFTEAQRYKQMDGEQAAHYERFMADTFGINVKRSNPGTTVYDTLRKTTKINSDPLTQIKSAKGIVGTLKATESAGGRMFINPSEQFEGKFWNSIDRKLTAWAQKGSKKTTYEAEVGKPMRDVLKTIETVIKESNTRNQLNNKLKPFGLTADTAYDARRYLEWLADGGHTQSGNEYLKIPRAIASNIAKSQANFNIPWVLGNGVDMIRVYSHYATQKGGISAILKGTAAAAKAGLIKKYEPFEKMGIYGTQHLDTSEKGFDPFSRSIIIQKNLVAHIEQARGGDVHKGIRQVLFDAKPWDQPAAYRNPDINTFMFGLARYTISETRYIYKTTKAAMQGDKEAAANLILYNIAKGALLGQTSLIPAPVWMALPQEWKDNLKKWEEQTGANWVKIGSAKIFHELGSNLSLDLSEYSRPGGGTLGARLASLKNSAQSMATYTGKAAMDSSNGKPYAALFHTMAMGSAALNILGVNQWFFQYAPKSATLTKLLDTTGNILSEDMEQDKASEHVAKAVFGERNIKKAE